MSEKPFISIVSPIYKAKNSISTLINRISLAVEEITDNYEIILVEDGCPQNSWETILLESQKNHHVKGLKLSRNFGQHAAITAGLEVAKGDWIVVMDCDLQDVPENIPLFFNKAIEGYDLVVGKKINRQDNIFRKIESYIFYKFIGKLTGVKVSTGIGNFGIYSRKVIDSLLLMEEEFKSFGIQVIWLGFNRIEIEINSEERHEGKSSYTFWSKWSLALNTISSFSNRILGFIIGFGVLIFMIALSLITINIFSIWFNPNKLPGWSSIILSIYLSLGLIISSIGIVGLYVGKIFSQVKYRPNFLVSEVTETSSYSK